MDPLEEYLELYAYDEWATRRVLEAVRAAEAGEPGAVERDLGGSFSTILATLTHLMGAEWIWLSRWQGSSPTALPEEWELGSLEAVTDRWAEVRAQRRAFVEGLSEEDLDEPLDYRNTKGEAFTNPLHQLLRHVVNHATYHRGQVVHMLRQLGAEAPSTDLILYHREKGA